MCIKYLSVRSAAVSVFWAFCTVLGLSSAAAEDEDSEITLDFSEAYDFKRLSGMDAVQYCVLSPKKFIYVLRLDKAEGTHLPVIDQSKIITATKESLDISWCISEGIQQTTLYMK